MRLDHVIIAVADLDAATDRFRRLLGRPAAIRSDHPRGTRNALFLFPSGPYLELLGEWDAPEQGTSAAALRRRLAERGEGLHGCALAPDDLDGAAERIRTLGFDIIGPVANSGTDAAGRVREWRAATLPETADDRSYLVEHRGWDWRTELYAPAEAARAGAEVTGIHHIAFDVPDADLASAAWNERLGLRRTDRIDTERMGARVNIHDAGAATVEFVSATRADGAVAARVARRGYGLHGLALSVADLDRAVAAVRAAGIAVGAPEPGVLPRGRVARIDPAQACGVAVQLLAFD